MEVSVSGPDSLAVEAQVFALAVRDETAPPGDLGRRVRSLLDEDGFEATAGNAVLLHLPVRPARSVSRSAGWARRSTPTPFGPPPGGSPGWWSRLAERSPGSSTTPCLSRRRSRLARSSTG